MADGDELYGRVLVVNVDGRQIVSRTNILINAVTGKESSTGLRMAFRIEQSLKPAPNQAELRIWNLNEESRKMLVKDALVSIEAGYSNDTSLIFLGDMKKIDHLRDGPDWITHLRIGDGEKEIKSARVNTSMKKATPLQAMQKIMESFGLPVKSALDKARKGDLKGGLTDFAAGFVAAGRSWDEATKLASTMGYDLSIQNGEVLMLGPEETNGPNAVVLDSESGLIGSPEQAESSGERVKHTIIKAKALLNGRGFAPGKAVSLQSREFNGFARVEKVTITGDTHGQEWECDMELKGLSPDQGFTFEAGEL